MLQYFFFFFLNKLNIGTFLKFLFANTEILNPFTSNIPPPHLNMSNIDLDTSFHCV